MAKKKNVSNDTLLIAGAVAVIGFFLLNKKNGNDIKIPSIIVNPPAVNFPGFNFVLGQPSFKLPGNLAGGGVQETPLVQNITINTPDTSRSRGDALDKTLEALNNAVAQIPNNFSLNTQSPPPPTLPDLPQASQTGGFIAIAKDEIVKASFGQGYEGTKAFYSPAFSAETQAVATGGQVTAGVGLSQLGAKAFQGGFLNIGESAIVSEAGPLTKAGISVLGRASPALGLVTLGAGTLFSAGALTAAGQNYREKSTPESAGNVGVAVAGVISAPLAIVPGIGIPAKLIAGLGFGALGYVAGYGFETTKDAVFPSQPRANPGVPDTGTAFGTPDLEMGDFEANLSPTQQFAIAQSRANRTTASSSSVPSSAQGPFTGFNPASIRGNIAYNQYVSAYHPPASSSLFRRA